jgi:integrase
MKQVTKLAKHECILPRDPAADIGYPSEKEHERTVAQEPHEIVALLPKSRRRPCQALSASGDSPGSRTRVQQTGSPRSTWEHIDFTVGDTGSITFERTRNGVKRRHQIMPRIREALLARKARLAKRRKSRKIKVEDNYVLGRLDGTKMSDFKKAWNTVRKECGFEDLHFHDCRHTFGSRPDRPQRPADDPQVYQPRRLVRQPRSEAPRGTL